MNVWAVFHGRVKALADPPASCEDLLVIYRRDEAMKRTENEILLVPLQRRVGGDQGLVFRLTTKKR